ncbi:MAG: NAD(P)/FAD-dependent oxidoreductase [Actinobacteria bacterium]|nr:NAD(P)/FAD-dependent oxidoreductase [Actinomycetota bacterium]MCA1739848.1 NAD(P)/FAD-dependent oxidoreductase [Actinomycetota bacterium]
MAEKFDAIILGMGPGGENVAGRLLKAGKNVAVVERELLGGECAYWACIPSKTLLRPPELKGEATRAFGTGTPHIYPEDLFDYRDYIIRNLDDSGQVENYEGMGARVIRGEGHLAGQGRVEVNGETLEADHVVVATGSEQNMLPIEGVEEVTVWTNREATTTHEIPGRAVIVGGGANGIETSQWLSRLGCSVTIVQSPETLINREDPQVGELLKGYLEEEGIGVRVSRRAEKARKEGEDAVITLDDGEEIRTDVLIMTAGRTPRVEGIGLDSIGVEENKGGLTVDDHCRVEGTSGLWAVGDVTGVLLFTHVAQYQGRIVATNILGEDRRADYKGVPRVVFSDPEVAATGLTEEQARDRDMNVASINLDLSSSIARPVTYEREPRGDLGLVVDRDERVIVGAWAVAPQAGEWIHQACLAVKARIPIDTMLDSVFQFPTFSQGYLEALEKLDL